MKYLSKIIMSLIISVALIGCAQQPVDETNDGFKSSDNGKLVKIYNDSNIVIYKHSIEHGSHGSFFYKFIYINKSGGVETW